MIALKEAFLEKYPKYGSSSGCSRRRTDATPNGANFQSLGSSGSLNIWAIDYPQIPQDNTLPN